MSDESFNCVFGKVQGILESKKNNRPDKIPTKQKVAMVLEYVLFHHLCFPFRQLIFHLIFFCSDT